jgi:transcriptional regulator GlxA family with amidase domain
MGRRVVGLVFPEFQLLDATGPLEVFSAASRLLERDAAADDRRRLGVRGPAVAGASHRPAYQVELVSMRGGPVSSSSGIGVQTRGAGRVRGPIDTLIVAGGVGVGDALGDLSLVAWTARTSRRARRVVSVCTGAFVLAEAGLLDGMRVTTHWSACGTLARRYPDVIVDPDPIYVRHENLATSAGVTSGMDLALALVEEDHGRGLALEVARWLVLFLKRPGGQSQFSGALRNQFASRPPVAEVQAWLVDHLAEDLSVSVLAGRAGMSHRTFSRVFKTEVGTTPARYVEGLRVDAARRDLEDSRHSMHQIASRCGFGTIETMYRSFQRVLGVTPGEYRGRFSRTAASA